MPEFHLCKSCAHGLNEFIQLQNQLSPQLQPLNPPQQGHALNLPQQQQAHRVQPPPNLPQQVQPFNPLHQIPISQPFTSHPSEIQNLQDQIERLNQQLRALQPKKPGRPPGKRTGGPVSNGSARPPQPTYVAQQPPKQMALAAAPQPPQSTGVLTQHTYAAPQQPHPCSARTTPQAVNPHQSQVSLFVSCYF